MTIVEDRGGKRTRVLQPLAISLGDPAGVGPEVTARAWEARDSANLPPFFALGDIESVRAVWTGPVKQKAYSDRRYRSGISKIRGHLPLENQRLRARIAHSIHWNWASDLRAVTM